MMRALLASTSTLHNQKYLAYLEKEISELFKNSSEVIFIPYARPGGITYDEYTTKASEAFLKAGISLKGLHEFKDPAAAIVNAEGVFTGGGNTFLLVSELYRKKVMPVLKSRIREGISYMGTSAGTNIAGLTMQTTNDMPIIYPPSFKTLGILPFNINPHFLDPDPDSKHKGETRETRINEFHVMNSQPVVGLREGSWLALENDQIILKGNLEARIFRKEQSPEEVKPGTDLKNLN